MTLSHALLLFFSALAAGTINAIAGGGTFFTFPALLLTGISPVAANATSSLAVWPGSLASAWAYRQESEKNKHLLPQLLVTTLIGSTAGALVLLYTPERTFAGLVPWLLLTATILFTFGPRVSAFFRRQIGRARRLRRVGKLGTVCLQLLIGFYAGYFGGAAGILTITLLALMGLTNIHEMNALKSLFGTSANWIAVILFMLKGVIVWPAVGIMIAAATIGGYFGAHYGKRLPPKLVRGIVIGVACLLTIYFFVKG
jgi:uncharacterized membrane protein YfcA